MPLLSKALTGALNHHVTQELAASHWYLGASAMFNEAGLLGMAKWMMAQSDEERMHAMKFVHHIQQRHGHVRLEQIPAPPAAFKSPKETFEAALALEVATTSRIHELHAKSLKEEDVALRLFLDWFVQEQLEEEDTLRTILDRFRLAGDDRAATLMLDAELGGQAAAPKRP